MTKFDLKRIMDTHDLTDGRSGKGWDLDVILKIICYKKEEISSSVLCSYVLFSHVIGSRVGSKYTLNY
jgi:hypothetical protein